MLTTEFKYRHGTNIFVFKPTGILMCMNGIGVQEFEVHRCPDDEYTTWTLPRIHVPKRATRADVVANYFAPQKRNDAD